LQIRRNHQARKNGGGNIRISIGLPLFSVDLAMEIIDQKTRRRARVPPDPRRDLLCGESEENLAPDLRKEDESRMAKAV
jgi:hypothetical protein